MWSDSFGRMYCSQQQRLLNLWLVLVGDISQNIGKCGDGKRFVEVVRKNVEQCLESVSQLLAPQACDRRDDGGL